MSYFFLPPHGDLGAFGDQNTEAETTNTGALSNAGGAEFFKSMYRVSSICFGQDALGS